jgi:thioredoxin-like negative regulator of GroEL
MDTPPAASRETLQVLTVEAANLAADLAQALHELSDVEESLDDSEMLVRIRTTKALWVRDKLVSIFTMLADDDS